LGWFPIALVAVSVGLLAGILFLSSSGTAAAQSCFLPVIDPCLGGTDPSASADGGSAPNCSPIIIDVSGEGFQLTSALGGVQFDIKGTGKPIQTAWTAAGVQNAFLVLDRNNDGLINSGFELFGNFSPQPPSPFPNGFLALGEFDKPTNGGNGDGIIDSHDAVFTDLRLWIDLNHDGISQPAELFKLPDLGVHSISLNYQESRRTDQYGNLFRYHSKINVLPGQNGSSEASPAAYDVFLTASQ
jgi:hypothetical protein